MHNSSCKLFYKKLKKAGVMKTLIIFEEDVKVNGAKDI